MKKILMTLVLLCFASCLNHRRNFYMVDFIENTNANHVQKQALLDGCSMTATPRQNQTMVRDSGGIFMNPYYMDNKDYTGTWRDGYWMCYFGSAGINQPYLRGWNALGFKGDSISYKGN